MKTKIIILTTIVFVIYLVGCIKKDNINNISDTPILPKEAYSYNAAAFPNHFFNPQSNMKLSNIDNEVATLGRVLFYDTKLSLNNTVSCGTCHNQQKGFADGKQASEGLWLKTTPRNSMSLCNPINQSAFFWDLRENNLNTQVLKPIQNHIEMGMEKIDNLPAKLEKTSYYKSLFNKAYGSESITNDKISEALSSFIKSLVTYQSKYDQVKQHEANFTSLEAQGYKLFNEKYQCQSCHTEPDFSPNWGSSPANIGLDKVSVDKGFQNTEQFKIPSLRNISVTGPYMHDGRFNTLEEVIEHYSSGVQFNSNLAWNFQDIDSTGTASKAKKLNITTTDKKALIAFLNTLTDYKMMSDPKYSNPFIY